MATLKQNFKNYLIEKKLSEGTANSYASGIEKVCKEEKCTWEMLEKNIDTILPMYEKDGPKENIGAQLSGSVRAGLSKFSEFVRSRKSHDWTYGEDFICCIFYIQTYIVNRKHLPLSELVRQTIPFLPNIVENSIRAKYNNIKQICLLKCISDTADFASFPDVSKQNSVAFDEAYRILI